VHNLDEHQTAVHNIREENTCLYAHTCIQTYIYIFICICDYLSTGEFECLLWWGNRLLHEVCYSSNKSGLYVIVHGSSPLLLLAILSSVGNWSSWPPTDWTFWEAFRILVTCKEIFCTLMFVRGRGLE
jgi:hypothetical protein